MRFEIRRISEGTEQINKNKTIINQTPALILCGVVKSFLTMWLENLKVRVRKYPKGYAVEIEQTKQFLWFKRTYWTHLIGTSGMKDVPWYYKTKEIAIKEAVKYLEWDLLISAQERL